jgi:hypothetical protein
VAWGLVRAALELNNALGHRTKSMENGLSLVFITTTCLGPGDRNHGRNGHLGFMFTQREKQIPNLDRQIWPRPRKPAVPPSHV